MMRSLRDPGESRVRDRIVGHPQLIGGVCIAVQSEDTSGFLRGSCHPKVKILTRHVAVNFDRNPLLCSALEHGRPVSNDSRDAS